MKNHTPLTDERATGEQFGTLLFAIMMTASESELPVDVRCCALIDCALVQWKAAFPKAKVEDAQEYIRNRFDVITTQPESKATHAILADMLKDEKPLRASDPIETQPEKINALMDALMFASATGRVDYTSRRNALFDCAIATMRAAITGPLNRDDAAKIVAIRYNFQATAMQFLESGKI